MNADRFHDLVFFCNVFFVLTVILGAAIGALNNNRTWLGVGYAMFLVLCLSIVEYVWLR